MCRCTCELSLITRILRECGADSSRIIDLQMEGSSGSPGPTGGESLLVYIFDQSMLTSFIDTNYEVKNLEVLTYNP